MIMPRIRAIKPQFWIDEGLAEVCREARLLYIGLWNLCDDRGVFEYRAAKIRVQLFPYDTDLNNGKVDEWLQELNTSGHIICFQENSKDYGYIPTFLKHQEIKKPSKWSFTTNLPESNSIPPVTHQLPDSIPPVTQQRLEVRGKRYKEEVKGIRKETDVVLPKWIDKELWDSFLEMRKKIKKPPTDLAKELLIKELEKLKSEGNDPNEVLKRSIMRNYAGVFPLKEVQQNGKHKENPRKLPTKYTNPDDL